MALMFLFGCGDSTKEEWPFKSNPELLSEECELTQAGKWFCPPIGFEPAPDSILILLQQTLSATNDNNENVTMTHVFFDTLQQAGLLLTQIHGLTLETDTALFLENYLLSLNRLYSETGVQDSSAISDSLVIRYYSVSDGTIARFQAVCMTHQEDAVEFNFFCPDAKFAELLPRFKSSLGTLKILSE